MDRPKEIEECSREQIRKASEIKWQKLKCLNLQYVFFATLLSLQQLDIFFCSMKSFLICSPPLPEQLQSIIHDTPCAGDALRIALQTNTGSSSESLTFGDAKKWPQNARIKKSLTQFVKSNLTL
ncbi:hypothetical protein [Raoultella planticola]|uniref:hypothetical protein n=1 Tax=Raoultella planticola TaxID=575 RepID=UPI001E5544AF|nr:hypothetical protein [Raoultella planticola]